MAGWEWCSSASGRLYAKEELAALGLSKYERGQLGELMTRAEEGRLARKDWKYLKAYGLYELRLDVGTRIFRLLYAKRESGELLVAALFTGKKADKLPKATLKAAKARVKEWDSRTAPS